MADGSAEENIQFSLEAADLDEDIQMTNELCLNEDAEEDCILSEEEKNEKYKNSFFINSLLCYYLS